MAEGEARWSAEAAFFDREAERAAARLQPFDRLTIERYRSARAVFAREFIFRVLGDLRGKRVLDVGCGDGQQSVLMALLGARVVGIDLSAGALEVARRRAELNGVGGAIDFHCAPIETADPGDAGFDVVYCDAILHHLLDDLDAVMAKLVRWVAPGGRFVCVEPLSLSPALRWLRARVPVDAPHTPGERPLEDRDLAVLRRHLPDLALRRFRLLGRIDRFVMPGHDYEHAPVAQRAAIWALTQLDAALLRVPALQRFGSVAVMWGSPHSTATAAAAGQSRSAATAASAAL